MSICNSDSQCTTTLLKPIQANESSSKDGRTDGLTSNDTLLNGKVKKSRKSRKPKFRYPLVWILWDDASVDNSWGDPETLEIDATPNVTVGFLVKETDNHVVVVSTYSHEDWVNARVQIPKGMITARGIL